MPTPYAVSTPTARAAAQMSTGLRMRMNGGLISCMRASVDPSIAGTARPTLVARSERQTSMAPDGARNATGSLRQRRHGQCLPAMMRCE